MPAQLASSRKNYALSALIAARALREARKARPKGSSAVAGVVFAHQVANARTSDLAVGEMLLEQQIEAEAEAVLDLAQFTTTTADLDSMLVQIETDWQFDRLIASIVQDAGRAAESVAVATRRRVGWVRHLTLPSCDRCVPLAGRVYRFSDGFRRHPGCDCTMTPVLEGDVTYVEDPAELVRRGLVVGLSKVDQRAILDGADFNRVVNLKRMEAGLMQAGQALTRGGRPTPAGIYRMAGDDREKALELLRRYRYLK